MRMLLIAGALLAAGCRTAATTTATAPVSPAAVAAAAPPATSTPAAASPAATSAGDLVDHLGDSIETAVLVPVDVPHEGVDWQRRWIFDRFGRFREKTFAMAHAPGSSGHERHYDVFTFEVPSGEVHTVYFDMTDFWAHQPAPSPAQVAPRP